MYLIKLLNKIIILFLSAVFCFHAAAQQGPVVSAQVDRNQMAVGDTFTLTISISSSENVTAGEPRLAGIEDFELLNSWKGSESRSTFVNGKFSVERSITFNYQMAAKKSGNLTLGSFEVLLDGKVYNTKPITLAVTDGPSTGNIAQGQRQQQQPDDQLPPDLFEEDDLFTQLLRRRLNPGIRTQPSNPNDSFFIQVDVDKQKVYVGEQIVATWYLFTKENIRDLDTLKYPSLNGFWKEDLEISTRLNFTSEVVNGIPYRKALLASYALFPIKAGTATIDPYRAKATFLNPFGFNMGQASTATKTSQPVKIQVLDLPLENKPKDFAGAVGQFTMSAKLETDKVTTNQPVILTIRFEGKGNAKVIDLPALNLPPSFELYDTKSETKYFPTGNSFKEFLVFLIPREAGEFTIPPATASFFDSAKTSYYSLKSEPFKILVTGAGPQQLAGQAFVKDDKSNAVDEDKSLKMVSVFKEYRSWSAQTSVISVAAVVLLLIGALAYKTKNEFSSGSLKKKLQEELQMRFKKIETLFDQNDLRSVGAEASNVIYLTLRRIVDNFENEVHFKQLMMQAPPSLRQKAGADLEQLMDYFQTIAFAPESVVGQLYDKKIVKKKVSELEKVIKTAVDSAGLSDDVKVAQ